MKLARRMKGMVRKKARRRLTRKIPNTPGEDFRSM
jgi:hypothetical protein